MNGPIDSNHTFVEYEKTNTTRYAVLSLAITALGFIFPFVVSSQIASGLALALVIFIARFHRRTFNFLKFHLTGHIQDTHNELNDKLNNITKRINDLESKR